MHLLAEAVTVAYVLSLSIGLLITAGRSYALDLPSHPAAIRVSAARGVALMVLGVAAGALVVEALTLFAQDAFASLVPPAR